VNYDDLNLEGLIDLLIQIIQRQFANDVSSIYVGDVGIITPRAFMDANGNQKAAVMIVPVADTKLEGTETTASVDRVFAIDLVTLVNMVPFFQAMPQEAFGVRTLIRLTQKMRTFFSQSENFSLAGNVSRVVVDDVNYSNLARKYKDDDYFYTAAAIRMEVTSNVPKLLS